LLRLAVALAFAFAALPAFALDAFPGARAVSFDGRNLLQAAQGGTPVERWREFIPEGEKLERWTRLASIREYPTHAEPKALAVALQATLKRNLPSAPSSFIENKATGEVIVDFIAWPPDRAFTEFNIFRYGKRDGGGVVAQQYAIRVYGDATTFLRGLKAERVRLLNAMAKDGLRAAR